MSERKKEWGKVLRRYQMERKVKLFLFLSLLFQPCLFHAVLSYNSHAADWMNTHRTTGSMDCVYYILYHTYTHNTLSIACYFNKTGASGYIRSTEIPTEVYKYYTKYDTPIECIWNITVQPEWQVRTPPIWVPFHPRQNKVEQFCQNRTSRLHSWPIQVSYYVRGNLSSHLYVFFLIFFLFIVI